MKEKIFVTKSMMPSYEAYIAEIRDLWESRFLTNMSQKHQQLQKQLEDFLKIPSFELLVNGHAALEFALESLPEKGEVITSPFTFVSTTHAIVRSGCTPVFCDINPKDFTMDVEKIESLMTEKTVAIMPIHVYGAVCDVYTLETLGKKYNIPIIYDAAHCFGVEVDGRGIGSFGAMSCFSFHATKVFHTVEGGGIGVNDPSYLPKIQALRNFGMEAGQVVLEGGNGKMHEFSAAMGLCNLKQIPFALETRKEIFSCYYARLKNAGLQCLEPQKNVTPNYAYFPVVISKESCGFTKEEVMTVLQREEIYPREYFYPITTEMPCYLGKYRGETPIAKEISEKVLCLPLYPELSLETVGKICDLICALH